MWLVDSEGERFWAAVREEMKEMFSSASPDGRMKKRNQKQKRDERETRKTVWSRGELLLPLLRENGCMNVLKSLSSVSFYRDEEKIALFMFKVTAGS